MKKVLIIILVVVLAFGAVAVVTERSEDANLFSSLASAISDTEIGTGTVTLKKPKKKDFGGTIVRFYDFEDQHDPGIVKDLKYGILSFSYKNAKFTNSQAGLHTDPYFAFNFGNPSDANVINNPSLSDYDYFSAEFDMTFGSVVPDMFVTLFCRNSSNAAASNPMIVIKNSGGKLYCDVGGTLSDHPVEIVDDTVHFSIFVAPNETPENSVCLIYMNGEYIGECEAIKANAVTVNSLRVWCYSGYTTVGGESITVDNVLLAVFGNGDGEYMGGVDDLFDDPDVDLKKCDDSNWGGEIQ